MDSVRSGHDGGTNHTGVGNEEGGDRGRARGADEPAGNAVVPTDVDDEAVVVTAEPDDTKGEPEKEPPLESEGGTHLDQSEREPFRKVTGRRAEPTRLELLKRDYDAMRQDYKARLAQKDTELYQLEKLREKRERQLRAELTRLANNLEDQEKKFETNKRQYLKERDDRQAELDNLRILHIKSVNSVDTGLEPILDDQMREKFDAIHSEVNGWCRKAFPVRGTVRELGELEKLGEMLGKRITETNALKFGQFLDTLLWLVMEETIFSYWFPDDWQWARTRAMGELEQKVRNNGSPTANEKAEYWRAYTASLLFQNPETKEDFSKSAEALTKELCKVLSRVLTPETPGLGEHYRERLREISNTATLLAAEMRCQRSFYELERDVRPGEPFDEKRMEDIGGVADEEDAGQFYVTCILSRGWVRKPYRGSREESNRICKARVLVTRLG